MGVGKTMFSTAVSALAHVHDWTGFGEWFGTRQDAILVYHQIGEPPPEFFGQISPERFDADLSYLTSEYEVVPLDEVTTRSERPRVALTFDDGLASFHGTVLPLLRKFDVPATVFVTPALLGDRNRELARNAHSIDYDGRITLTEDEVFDLVDEPLVTIGSHSLTHRNLADVGCVETLRREIVASRDRLEHRFGVDVTAFSYPYGEVTDTARALVESNYEMSVTTKPYLVDAPATGHQLPRVAGHLPRRRLSWELTPLSDRVNAIRYR